MNKKTISPNPQQPVDRKPAGKLPNALAELSEAALSSPLAVSQAGNWIDPQTPCICSYDGDEE